jgi:hypothetical protein
MFALVTLAVAMCLTVLLAYVDEVKTLFREKIWDQCLRKATPEYARV